MLCHMVQRAGSAFFFFQKFTMFSVPGGNTNDMDRLHKSYFRDANVIFVVDFTLLLLIERITAALQVSSF